MEYTQIIIIAILIEAIWENLKMVWQNGKINIDKIGALVISIIICLLVNANVFSLVDLTISVQYIANILTGIIVSRGANVVHDLFSKLSNIKNNG